MEQKENLLQISPVPHRSKFFNFLFQIVKWGNFAETLVYNTLCFTFASPEIQKNRVRPHCAVMGETETQKSQFWLQQESKGRGMCVHVWF